MLAVVYCKDVGGSVAMRDAAIASHRAYVDTHAPAILLSGPLLAADSATRVGQLFVLEVPEFPAAERFIAEDPLTGVGVFTEVHINAFLPIFRDGVRIASVPRANGDPG